METSEKVKTEIFPAICKIEFSALGTEIELRIVVNDGKEKESATRDLDDARRKYEDFQRIFSRFDPQSELSKINANLNVFQDASFEILEISQHSLKFNEDTQGFFDPRIIGTLETVGYCEDFKKGNFILSDRIEKRGEHDRLSDDLKINGGQVFFGTRMDFSGIAKGFITDKISQFLMGKGWKNFFVDSGGDMYFSGKDQMGDSWRIDVEGIDHEKMMLELSEKGIATSGISKRKWEAGGKKFHHLINPKKREEFLFELKTVTVVADSTEEADVWAKTLFLMGKEKGIVYAKENDVPAVFLYYNGNAWISPAIKKFAY